MSANIRHRWADVIIAWANGEEVQLRSDHGAWATVKNISIGTFSFWPSEEWRIKPKQQTGWINIYPQIEGESTSSCSSTVWINKEEADKHCDTSRRVACVQITFTEGEGL